MSVFEFLPWPIRMDWVLTVVVGGSVVGMIVVLVGVVVVSVSALGQPVRSKCLRCYSF